MRVGMSEQDNRLTELDKGHGVVVSTESCFAVAMMKSMAAFCFVCSEMPMLCVTLTKSVGVMLPRVVRQASILE